MIMIDPFLQSILVSLGTNLTSSAVYDFVKSFLSKNEDLIELKKSLGSFLKSTDAADKTIDYLINSGKLKVQGSSVFAGSIDLEVKDANEAIGAHIVSPTIFLPGSSIKVKAENVKTAIGLKIGQ